MSDGVRLQWTDLWLWLLLSCKWILIRELLVVQFSLYGILLHVFVIRWAIISETHRASVATDKATDRVCGGNRLRRLRHILLNIKFIACTIETRLRLLLNVDIKSVLVRSTFQHLARLLSLHGLGLA